jgi:hypothetical protein
MTRRAKTVSKAQAPAPLPEAAAKIGTHESGTFSFRIIGVDRNTGLDRTWVTRAATEANAKVKGELQGIIVTAVESL